MDPIISGIGSTPNKLMKAITNRKITPSYIKNSGNLVEKINGINMTDKFMASLDVNPFIPTSLLTNA